jgi:hypothetical protein
LPPSDVAKPTRHFGFSGPMLLFSGATPYFPDQSGHVKPLRQLNVYSGAMGYRDIRDGFVSYKKIDHLMTKFTIPGAIRHN